MEKVEVIGRTVVKMWTTDIDDFAREQINNLASLPFVHHHIALMPDCHGGMGMPIGGVLPTKNVVIPNAVGVDIGCGMCAVKDEKGIIHSLRSQRDLDEAASAHKDIDQVIALESDLVKVMTKLDPIAVIKGQ